METGSEDKGSQKHQKENHHQKENKRPCQKRANAKGGPVMSHGWVEHQTGTNNPCGRGLLVLHTSNHMMSDSTPKVKKVKYLLGGGHKM